MESHNKLAEKFIILAAVLSCISLSGMNLVIGLFVVLFLFDIYKTKSIGHMNKDFSIFIAMYTWKGFTAALNNLWSNIVGIREIWDKLPYIVVGRFKVGKKVVEKYFSILLIINNILIIYAILQWKFSLPIIYRPFMTKMWEGVRMNGFFSHPMHYAGYISTIILLTTALSMFYDKRYAKYLPLLFVGLILTASRSYYLGVTIGMLALSYVRSPAVLIKTSLGIATTLGAYSLINPWFLNRITSIWHGDLHARMVYVQIAWQQFLNNMFTGIGYDQFTVVLGKYLKMGIISHPAHGHNIYTHDLAEGGILGFALMVFMIVWFIKKYLTSYQKLKSVDALGSGLCLGMFATFISFAIAGLFEYHFSSAVVWINLTFQMGVLEAYRNSIGADAPANHAENSQVAKQALSVSE